LLSDTITKNFKMINNSYLVLNEMVWSAYLMKNILLANVNNYYYNTTVSKPEFVQFNVDLMQLSIKNLGYYINNITQSDLEIVKNHSDLLYSDTIKYYYIDDVGNKRMELDTLVNIISQVIIYNKYCLILIILFISYYR